MHGAKKVPWAWLSTSKTEKIDLCSGAQKPADQKDWKKLWFKFSVVFYCYFTPLHSVCNQMLKPVQINPKPKQTKPQMAKSKQTQKA